jgi:hypothetical protein
MLSLSFEIPFSHKVKYFPFGRGCSELRRLDGTLLLRLLVVALGVLLNSRRLARSGGRS